MVVAKIDIAVLRVMPSGSLGKGFRLFLLTVTTMATKAVMEIKRDTSSKAHGLSALGAFFAIPRRRR